MIYDKAYNAVVLDTKDPLNQGRYKVYISKLYPLSSATNPSDSSTIWVKNHIHKYRDNTRTSKRYGQYFPLQPGTQVLVKFYYPNDLNSGYIDRILDDDFTTIGADKDHPSKFKFALPFNAKTEDRDEIYQIIRTPKHDCLFLISEDTATDWIPKESIHLYFKRNKSVLVIDDSGINWKTDNNEYHTVGQDYDIKIDENFFNETRWNYNLRVGGEYRHSTQFDMHFRSTKGNIYLEADHNSINLIAPAATSSINLLSSAYLSLVAHNGITAIGGKTKVVINSDKKVIIVSSEDMDIIANKKMNIISMDELVLHSDKAIVLDAPHIKHSSSQVNIDPYLKDIQPSLYEQVEDNFFDDYDLSNYAHVDDLPKVNKKTDTVQDILDHIYTFLPRPETIESKKNRGTYYSKFAYTEAKEQQKQNKDAEKLVDIHALIAQRAFPPEPNVIEFEEQS